MNVTIIGAGNMGCGIGHRLVAGGHDVMSWTGPLRRPLGLKFQSAWKLIS
jgi:3-hydroxyisobutyrate dehydrogenase-like beta-hydroxyacid dehydrogenase